MPEHGSAPTGYTSGLTLGEVQVLLSEVRLSDPATETYHRKGRYVSSTVLVSLNQTNETFSNAVRGILRAIAAKTLVLQHGVMATLSADGPGDISMTTTGDS